jgi:hypothetical protein
MQEHVEWTISQVVDLLTLQKFTVVGLGVLAVVVVVGFGVRFLKGLYYNPVFDQGFVYCPNSLNHVLIGFVLSA